MNRPIELLVFSAQHLVFGAYAGQVAEVSHSQERYIQSENGLFFFPHNEEKCLGVDFTFWLRYYSEQKNAVFEHNTHPFPSTLLLLHLVDCVYSAVWVDVVEEFLTVSLDCLHTLPVFMQKSRHASALWGIAHYKNHVIPLIDLSKLSMAQPKEILRDVTLL